MTQDKPPFWNMVSASLCAAGLICGLPFGRGASAMLSVWQDNTTGFALAGFHPLAYFTKSKPVPGVTGTEHKWGGVTWRFTNTGNRDAFAKHPEACLPKFAGYDVEALSRGLAVEGNPTVWVIHAGKVHLFHSRESLNA